MNSTRLTITACLLASAAIAGCGSGPPKISMREAMRFENEIIAAGKNQPASSAPEELYTQPANKTEPCKLRTSKDQLERRNFRAYWDGECRDGYAFGLGRDIAMSDTHHYEEITVLNRPSPEKERPHAFYNFIENYSTYGSSVDETKTTYQYSQRISRNPDDSIHISTSTGEVSKETQLTMAGSPFAPASTTVNVRKGRPVYSFTDYSAAPATSDQAAFAVQVLDPNSKQAVGYRIVRFRNGVVEHQGPAGLGSGGLVQLPQEYVNHLLGKLTEANAAVSKANAAASRAQQVEREYLYASCKSGYIIEGVPAEDLQLTREICTWREKWKEPYAKAQANYEQKMGEARQQVAAKEQQLALQRTQQQLAFQQQQAVNAAAWQSINQSLQQTTNSIQQQTQQLMNFQAPQVQPIGQPRNQVVCNTIGNTTICQ